MYKNMGRLSICTTLLLCVFVEFYDFPHKCFGCFLWTFGLGLPIYLSIYHVMNVFLGCICKKKISHKLAMPTAKLMLPSIAVEKVITPGML